jgi:hypothetical protein
MSRAYLPHTYCSQSWKLKEAVSKHWASAATSMCKSHSVNLDLADVNITRFPSQVIVSFESDNF